MAAYLAYMFFTSLPSTYGKRIMTDHDGTVRRHLFLLVRLKKTRLQKLQYLQNGVVVLYEIFSDH